MFIQCLKVCVFKVSETGHYDEENENGLNYPLNEVIEAIFLKHPNTETLKKHPAPPDNLGALDNGLNSYL